MNSSNKLSLKYQRFTTIGYKEIGIWKSEFVAKTKFIFNKDSEHPGPTVGWFELVQVYSV